jgi:hydrogenase maturation factor
MNSACQAIAAAKHSPIIFRLRNSQRLNGPGNSDRAEDAANARYSKGIAHRTDSWIIDETPGPEDKSVRIIVIITAMDIGPVMSQNNRHLLMAFVFNISFSSMLIDIRYS